MHQKHPPILPDRWHFIALLAGLVIAIYLLISKFGDVKTNFEDAKTFGAGTTDLMYSINGHKIHCGDSRDAEECLNGAQKNTHQQIALWLGNSQLQSVNQLRPNELNAPPLAFQDLNPRNIYLMAFSQPNANLQEHLLTFTYLNNQIKLRYLILPVVFDDFREDGIRSELIPFAKNTATAQQLSTSKIGQKIIQLSQISESNDQSSALTGTAQSYTENILNKWFDKTFIFWQARPEARGQLLTELYMARNTIFGITPSSKRKVIKGRYQDNLNALIAILKLAQGTSTQVLIYIPPLRNDVDIPYVRGEYENFKKEINSIAQQHNSKFANFENLVPPDFWGSKTGTSMGTQLEIDFMHFQARGHSLLAKEVVKHLIN